MFAWIPTWLSASLLMFMVIYHERSYWPNCSTTLKNADERVYFFLFKAFLIQIKGPWQTKDVRHKIVTHFAIKNIYANFSLVVRKGKKPLLWSDNHRKAETRHLFHLMKRKIHISCKPSSRLTLFCFGIGSSWAREFFLFRFCHHNKIFYRCSVYGLTRHDTFPHSLTLFFE